MNNHPFHSLILHSIITILCFLIAIPSSYCDDDEQYAACSRPNHCGGQLIPFFFYPFWGNEISRPQYCGRQGFELKCQDNQYPTIQFEHQRFRVLNINLPPIMVIARDDHFGNLCPAIFLETIINHNLFNYSPNVGNLSLFYNCGSELSSTGQNNFSCPSEGGREITGFYTIDENDSWSIPNRTNTCNRLIKVPILLNPLNIGDLSAGRLTEALKRGFEVEYRKDNEFCAGCFLSKGICGSSQSSDEFACLCRDKPHTRTCPSGMRALPYAHLHLLV